MAVKKVTAGAANKQQLLLILKSFGEVELEHRFMKPERQFRFDYAILDLKLAVEYQGHAGFIKGGASGHSTISGLTSDCEKFNQARLRGWTVICFTALHFTQKDRAKHKLTAPLDFLGQVVSKLNEENKNKAIGSGGLPVSSPRYVIPGAGSP